jgi:hypothetical protein
MPYLIRRPTKPRLVAAVIGAVALSLLFSALTAAPALAWGEGASSCDTNPPLSQPFVGWGDHRQYALVDGQDGGGFDGSRWGLLGGASIQYTQLADGGWGGALDLPSGSIAVSPPECVNSDYPDARMMVDDVTGDEGVEVYVSTRPLSWWWNGWNDWSDPIDSGDANGGQGSWQPSAPVPLPTAGTSDWELVRFIFVAGGTGSEFQISDLYVDPYSKG